MAHLGEQLPAPSGAFSAPGLRRSGQSCCQSWRRPTLGTWSLGCLRGEIVWRDLQKKDTHTCYVRHSKRGQRLVWWFLWLGTLTHVTTSYSCFCPARCLPSWSLSESRAAPGGGGGAQSPMDWQLLERYTVSPLSNTGLWWQPWLK